MPAPTIAPTPVQTPTVLPTPTPESLPWERRFTDPIHICPQQKRELTSPDVEP